MSATQPASAAHAANGPSVAPVPASTAHAAAASSHQAAASSIVAQSAPRMSRVLSIQSSVIYGYVGNKASNFPLQLLGFDVDPLHSCQLSNHTNYPAFSGLKTAAADVAKIWAGLQANKMLQQYTHLLTGYMTSVEFIEECAGRIEQLKKERPEMLFGVGRHTLTLEGQGGDGRRSKHRAGKRLCDPVMGDNSKLYVPESFVSIYRDRFLSLADVLTPNQTEAEQLTGMRILNESDAVETLQWFHARGVRTVVITSMTYPSAATTVTAGSASTAAEGSVATASCSPRLIHVLASTIESGSPKDFPRPTRYARMSFEYVPMYFSGTGDLTAALLLAWLTRLHEQEAGGKAAGSTSAASDVPAPPCFSFATVVRALELSMATLQAVIRRTFEAHSEELFLIQSKNDIEHPNVTQKAEIVENAGATLGVATAAAAHADTV